MLAAVTAPPSIRLRCRTAVRADGLRPLNEALALSALSIAPRFRGHPASGL
jgi:hypothetical protein